MIAGSLDCGLEMPRAVAFKPLYVETGTEPALPVVAVIVLGLFIDVRVLKGLASDGLLLAVFVDEFSDIGRLLARLWLTPYRC